MRNWLLPSARGRDTLDVRQGPRRRPFAHWCSHSPSWSLVPGLVPKPLMTRPPAWGRRDLVQETTRFHDRAGPVARPRARSSHASPLLGSEVIAMARSLRARRSRTPQLSRKPNPTPPVVHPDAAGIDIGATHLWAALPPDRSPETVRVFETFTEDLYALAAWLKAHSITTVAMESTGVYWIPVFQVLETCGIEVYLVNAHHAKNVPGRKTDVNDCQWLQYLHAVGLLRGSFRPPDEICAVRSLLRHRSTLVAEAAAHVQHMQKSLIQMNLQLHHVLSDLSGQSGLAIIDAMLAGERDPARLAQLRDPRVKASEETIKKALV